MAWCRCGVVDKRLHMASKVPPPPKDPAPKTMVGVRLSTPLVAALERYEKRTKASRTIAVEHLLRYALTEAGETIEE